MFVVQQHERDVVPVFRFSAAMCCSGLAEQEASPDDVDFRQTPRPVILRPKLVNRGVLRGIARTSQIRSTKLITPSEFDGRPLRLGIEIGE